VKRVKLTPKKLKDEDALGDAIDRVIGSSKKSRTLTRRVLRAQRRLRRAVGDRAWQLYMALEEAVNARTLWEGDRLVGWAFCEGRRRRRR
jgi:hypothetical protein